MAHDTMQAYSLEVPVYECNNQQPEAFVSQIGMHTIKRISLLFHSL
jgi:hypothetical protein